MPPHPVLTPFHSLLRAWLEEETLARPEETLLGVGGEGGGDTLAADAFLGLLGMHAPCVPCQDEARGGGQLVPLKQESTDGFRCQCAPRLGKRALDLGTWHPQRRQLLLLLPLASRKS